MCTNLAIPYIIDLMDTEFTAKDLRKKFLAEAKLVVAYGLAEATGNHTDESTRMSLHSSAKWVDKTWKLAEQLIATADDTHNLTVSTTKDIITAVTKGKISLDEATKLMSLFRESLEIDITADDGVISSKGMDFNIIVKDAKGDVKVTRGAPSAEPES